MTPLPRICSNTIDYLVGDYATLNEFLYFLTKQDGDVGHQAEVIIRCAKYSHLSTYRTYLREFFYTKVPVVLIYRFMTE